MKHFLLIIMLFFAAPVWAEDLMLSASEKQFLKDASKGSYRIIKSARPNLQMAALWLYSERHIEQLSDTQLDYLLNLDKETPRRSSFLREQERRFPSFYTDSDVLAFFKDREPATLEGFKKLYPALKRNGQSKKAEAMLKDWWVKGVFTPDLQKDFYRAYKKDLSQADHYDRLQYLLAPNAGQYTNARRIADLLNGKGWEAYVEARIGLQNPHNNQFNANASLARLERVNKALVNDPYLARDRFYWHKEQEKAESNLRAVEILAQAKSLTGVLPNPDGYWVQQRIVINRLIAAKEYKAAYKLASINPFKEGEARADIDFKAGWLALRKLKNPDAAVEHFKNMVDGVSTANSRSRAAYWLGLAYQSAKQSFNAERWFSEAAKYKYNFYGQLALEENVCTLDLSGAGDDLANSPVSAAVTGAPLKHIYAYLLQIDHPYNAYSFLRALSNKAENAADYRYLASFAKAQGNPFHSLMIAKEGYNVHHYEVGKEAFPVLDKNILEGLELKALVHAVIRQESGFDPNAKSRVGALGLTQLMPATAAKEAKDLEMTYRQDWLTSRPDYNVTLGEAHLKRLLEINKGKHIMRVLAGYNAGMGRVAEWIGIYGDPGKDGVNPVDWMESLPFNETRDYVRKVLENFMSYNAMFNEDSSKKKRPSCK
jgi:soluble lytic murein transglycosylase